MSARTNSAALVLLCVCLSPRYLQSQETLPLPALPALPAAKADTPIEANPHVEAGLVYRIEFAGLRRMRAAALREHIRSREGEPLDATLIENDVRALDQLGWFDSVSAEVRTVSVLLANARLGTSAAPGSAEVGGSLGTPAPPRANGRTGFLLLFVVEERPFLAGVEFRGSRVLSQERIERALAEKRIALRVAAPVRRVDLWHAQRAILAALAGLEHPEAQVRLHVEEQPGASVRAIFEIADGPAVPVARVTFAGNRAFDGKKLRRQMKRVAPDAYFAELRGKRIYTPDRLAEDLERLENFYRNHGYPEARVGQPVAEVDADRVRRWLPWPRRRSAPRFHISIPVEEGRFYRLAAVHVEKESSGGSGERSNAKAEIPLPRLKPGQPYSVEEMERAGDVLRHMRAARARKKDALPPTVEILPQFDREAGTVHVTFRVHQAQPYLVRRIEFSGQRRFADRYYRRQIQLREGEAFDPEKLERGLAQLARTGYIRPAKREDVRVRFDDVRHTADVAIHVEEIGRQRISLVGGHGTFGSTLGIVYTVFNLFGVDELLKAHMEGGPESLQVLLGVAMDGLLGTRTTLGLSVFENVVKPYMAGGAHTRLFTSSTSGLRLAAAHPVSAADTLGVSYEAANTTTQYPLVLPASLTGLVSNPLRASTASRSVGLTESRDTGRERLSGGASVSGGWLGGNENLLRSSVEYARIDPDPFTAFRARQNAWAVRGSVNGVASYRGNLPYQSRLFAGDQFLRGFRTGDLAPYIAVKTAGTGSASAFRAQSTGADLVAAVNTEYRVPLAARTEAAAFFDSGTGWLLPGWLGPDRPVLLGGTNGVLRASTGLELRWRVPVVEQTVRVHYAINPLRLTRDILLPDGGHFRPSERRGVLGWALGSLI